MHKALNTFSIISQFNLWFNFELARTQYETEAAFITALSENNIPFNLRWVW